MLVQLAAKGQVATLMHRLVPVFLPFEVQGEIRTGAAKEAAVKAYLLPTMFQFSVSLAWAVGAGLSLALRQVLRAVYSLPIKVQICGH